MAYILYKTNGVKLTVIEDGSIDKSSTSITLVGKNYSGYGQSINQNLIKLTENFSHNIEPSNSLTGQIWYDTGTKSLKVYSGTRYKKLSVIDSGISGKPADAAEGNFFFDDTEQKLYYYDGSAWLLVGPQFTGISSRNLIVPVQKYTTSGTDDKRNILLHQLEVGTAPVVAAVSSAESFTLGQNARFAGFDTGIIKAGITLNGTNSFGVSSTSTNAGSLFWGTASDALRFGGKLPSQYVSTDNPILETKGFSVLNDQEGISIGPGSGSVLIQAVVADSGNKEGIISSRVSAEILRINVQSGSTTQNVANFITGGGPAILPCKDVGVGTDIGASPNNNSVTKKPFSNIYGDNIKATYLLKTGYYADFTAVESQIISPEPGMIILVGTTFYGYAGGTWVSLSS